MNAQEMNEPQLDWETITVYRKLEEARRRINQLLDPTMMLALGKQTRAKYRRMKKRILAFQAKHPGSQDVLARPFYVP